MMPKNPFDTMLQNIEDATNEIIKEIRESEDFEKMGAVNWADLSCTDVQVCFSKGASSYMIVTIEECAPYAPLCGYVAQQLLVRGFHDIEVRGEW